MAFPILQFSLFESNLTYFFCSVSFFRRFHHRLPGWLPHNTNSKDIRLRRKSTQQVIQKCAYLVESLLQIVHLKWFLFRSVVVFDDELWFYEPYLSPGLSRKLLKRFHDDILSAEPQNFWSEWNEKWQWFHLILNSCFRSFADSFDSNLTAETVTRNVMKRAKDSLLASHGAKFIDIGISGKLCRNIKRCKWGRQCNNHQSHRHLKFIMLKIVK